MKNSEIKTDTEYKVSKQSWQADRAMVLEVAKHERMTTPTYAGGWRANFNNRPVSHVSTMVHVQYIGTDGPLLPDPAYPRRVCDEWVLPQAIVCEWNDYVNGEVSKAQRAAAHTARIAAIKAAFIAQGGSEYGLGEEYRDGHITGQITISYHDIEKLLGLRK